MSHFATFIGMDWADHKLDICLLDAMTTRKEFAVLDHTEDESLRWTNEGDDQGDQRV